MVLTLRALLPEVVMLPPVRTRRFAVILAAVDFSRDSARALRYAAAVARSGGGRVIAVHAFDPLLSAAATSVLDHGEAELDALRDLQRFVRTTLGDAAGEVRTVVRVGRPARVIAEAARRFRSDLVVLGTHGRGGVAELFLGSTAQDMLRRYRGALLVVPPASPGPRRDWPGAAIAAAVGAGGRRQSLLSAAADAAELFGAWLRLIDLAKPVPRSRWRGTRLVILPLPAGARFETFRQDSAAYRFIRDARSPVLVVRTGRRVGQRVTPSPRAA
jgi:nucleotide-binding universal stress UspA family protein